MESGEKDRTEGAHLISTKTINTIIAYTASWTLNGVPPIVCESALINLISSVKKSGKLISLNRIMHTLHHQKRA